MLTNQLKHPSTSIRTGDLCVPPRYSSYSGEQDRALPSSYFSSYNRNRQTNYQVQWRKSATKGLVKVALVAYIMDVILGTLGEV